MLERGKFPCQCRWMLQKSQFTRQANKKIQIANSPTGFAATSLVPFFIPFTDITKRSSRQKKKKRSSKLHLAKSTVLHAMSGKPNEYTHALQSRNANWSANTIYPGNPSMYRTRPSSTRVSKTSYETNVQSQAIISGQKIWSRTPKLNSKP